jgi:hypothetical protein
MVQYGLCFQYTTPYKKVSKYFYFQIIAGTINVVNFANKSVIQIRRVSSIYMPQLKHVDLSIVKVNLPFEFIYTVQGVTLAQSGYIPPVACIIKLLRSSFDDRK